ncbi:MAG: baseplate J/gp47 family protein [Parasphingorhabdus sp.]|nr:baseplate J/gp47 family protein [Parasphingorhabdus sp.]
MVSSIATSPAVDLSGLPAPDIIDQPSFETRLAAKIATLVGLVPEFDALLESDPAIKLIEADSYDEILLAQAFNDSARSLLLAYATGGALDHLGSLMDVARLELVPANLETGDPAVMESDSEYRARILIAPHSFSVAGPELAYVYHARRADSDVLDASATSPNPGEVLISILSRTGDGTAPAATIAAVDTLLQSNAIRPLGDEVTVQSAEIVGFNINAALWLFAGPDSLLILQTATAALEKYLATTKRLGRDVTRSAIIAALHVAGVQRVDLIDPVDDVVLTLLQAGHPVNITITIAGTAE